MSEAPSHFVSEGDKIILLECSSDDALLMSSDASGDWDEERVANWSLGRVEVLLSLIGSKYSVY